MIYRVQVPRKHEHAVREALLGDDDFRIVGPSLPFFGLNPTETFRVECDRDRIDDLLELVGPFDADVWSGTREDFDAAAVADLVHISERRIEELRARPRRRRSTVDETMLWVGGFLFGTGVIVILCTQLLPLRANELVVGWSFILGAAITIGIGMIATMLGAEGIRERDEQPARSAKDDGSEDEDDD